MCLISSQTVRCPTKNRCKRRSGDKVTNKAVLVLSTSLLKNYRLYKPDQTPRRLMITIENHTLYQCYMICAFAISRKLWRFICFADAICIVDNTAIRKGMQINNSINEWIFFFKFKYDTCILFYCNQRIKPCQKVYTSLIMPDLSS